MRISFALVIALVTLACHSGQQSPETAGGLRRLPTGRVLDPAGTLTPVGQMPLAMLPAPDGRHLVLFLNGYRDQGLQVVDRQGRITQTLPQEAAFLGLAFSPDGKTLYASGGNQDVVYRYRWTGDSATLNDSLVLAAKDPHKAGTRYPAGLAVSADGSRLFVVENLADSLAVFDLASGQVAERLPTGRYPYAVAIDRDGTIFVSNWGASTLSVFTPGSDGKLSPAAPISAGRHPSTLLMNHSGTRLFVASGSTDRVTVVDPKSRRVIAELLDPPPAGPDEGTTPNALALSPDGLRLFAAEADANAIAVFDLTHLTADLSAATGNDRLAGRIPVGWYPTALLVLGDTLVVANGKGRGTSPNPSGPNPGVARVGPAADRQYTLDQIAGTLTSVPLTQANPAGLPRLTERVARANGWIGPAAGSHHYPPFTHVIYVLKENRTYDQVLGDLTGGDGDTSLVLFGQRVTPNQHAIAERFGLFDRFFVNAEVSADGHNWSMGAYATDYIQKVAPTSYSGDGRSYDYEGTNRDSIPADDVAEPAQGYLWDLAERARISFRNFGEMVADEGEGGGRWYRGTKPFLAANTDTLYPSFDLHIPDQRRADIWLAQFHHWEETGRMPTLQIVYLPRDHTSGGSAHYETPRAMVADNDLALGRVIGALSHSRFWTNTVVFVMEDDAQDGPDHVDSHRSPLLVISAWNRRGVYHRFTNTTDVLRTIEEILGLEALSQFDHFGRPLRDIWADVADPHPFLALTPAQPLDEMNPLRTRSALDSRRLDLAHVDAADMDLFNRILWRSVKGEVPYPGTHRMSSLEALRAR